MEHQPAGQMLSLIRVSKLAIDVPVIEPTISGITSAITTK